MASEIRASLWFARGRKTDATHRRQGTRPRRAPPLATRSTKLGVSYCAALRIGMFDLRNVRTRLIVRALSSGGSRHGKTVISALGASDATSIEVGSGCDGVSSGRTRIGVRQLLMNSRGTL